MKVVITGGAGFVGRRLAGLLAGRGHLKGPDGKRRDLSGIVLFDAAVPDAPPAEAPGAKLVRGDVAEPAEVRAVLDSPEVAVFHLGAMVSGGCEEDFDGAWRTNVEGTRNVLEAARALGSRPRLVFASTMGSFGGVHVKEPVGDFTKQSPETTYGMTKSIGELMVNDYTRKGFIDGRSARLATVVVRAGKPNLALSSYASAVVREPLAGVDYVCPVPAETTMPMIGYRTCAECLAALHEIDGERLGADRAVQVPGISASVTEMHEALLRVAGGRKLGAVAVEPDPLAARITAGWPREADNRRALELGLPADADIDGIIRAYIQDYVD